MYQFCVPVFYTLDNMNSVTSNAVANILNSYNSITTTRPTQDFKNMLDIRFSANTEYSAWYGGAGTGEEGAWYGFKHNNTKGGLCIYMSVYVGILFGYGSGLPSTWTWKTLQKA